MKTIFQMGISEKSRARLKKLNDNQATYIGLVLMATVNKHHPNIIDLMLPSQNHSTTLQFKDLGKRITDGILQKFYLRLENQCT